MLTRPLAVLLTVVLVTAPAYPCTVFLIAKGGRVLAGNNEDAPDPDSKIWFVTEPDDEHHGRVYFGFGNGFPQGGMNEKGLFFDGLLLGGEKDPAPADKPVFDGNLIDEAMKTCANVDEVVELFAKWDFGYSYAQFMFGDSGGKSVVIERDAVHRKEKDHQVVTNFRLSRQSPQESGCRRYAAATDVLAGTSDVTVDAARAALQAAQQRITVYSNVYDLVNGNVYLWLNHDFDTVAEFNLWDELEKGDRRMDLPDFFAGLVRSTTE